MNKNVGHVCLVEKQTSGSFLPPLPKEANCCQRFVRAYKKFIQVSESDPLTQEYFRSTTGFLNERKRHAQSKYSYVIHPFSDFAYCRDVVMFISLSCVYITAPLVTMFIHKGVCDQPWIYTLEFLTSIVFITDMVLKCFMAVDNTEGKEVILEQKAIIRNYMVSLRFVFDVLSAYSFCSVSHIVTVSHKQILTSFRMLKIFRLVRYLKYWAHIAQRCSLSAITTELVKYYIMTFMLIHWITCIIFFISESHSHTEDEGFKYFIFVGTLSAAYFASFFESMGILFSARSDWNEECTLEENIMHIVTFIFGKIYMLVITVITLNQVMNEWSLQTKYLRILDQLKEFMTYKKLPLNLRQRIDDYFDYRFRHKYFRENLITSILSDKIKREINIQVCRRLVQQAAFLADLPTKILGDVLTNLKSEVFLPNDVIIRAGAPGDCMYFLSSGTVLITTPSGKEVCHLQDGAYFGEIALLSKETKRTANVIALEICEAYRLDKNVFKMSIKKYPECMKVIQALAEIRHQETNALEEMHKEELFHKTYIGENETLEDSVKISRKSMNSSI